jgi:hypothetical protein
MKSRLDCFEELIEDFHYNRLFKKLKESEPLVIRTTLTLTDKLDANKFESFLNRMHIDDSKNRPKNWSIMCELMSAANSRWRFQNV